MFFGCFLIVCIWLYSFVCFCLIRIPIVILCILIDMFALFCIFFAYWHSPATLAEVFPCLFLSCKIKARVKLAKTGHGQHPSNLIVICIVLLLFVLFYVLFVCKCVLYYCHRLKTQLQLTNISCLGC